MILAALDGVHAACWSRECEGRHFEQGSYSRRAIRRKCLRGCVSWIYGRAPGPDDVSTRFEREIPSTSPHENDKAATQNGRVRAELCGNVGHLFYVCMYVGR
jgi:hypothetical protein